jgi:hypothetical protein
MQLINTVKQRNNVILVNYVCLESDNNYLDSLYVSSVL